MRSLGDPVQRDQRDWRNRLDCVTKLIDLYLLDCARKRKKLTMKWVA